MKIENPYKKNCISRFCEKEFLAKRLNQEYCSMNCKIQENNWKARELRHLSKPVAEQLKLNRKVLHTNFSDGKKNISMLELQMERFDLRINSGVMKDDTGKYTIPKFLDYTLKKISENNFEIIQLPHDEFKSKL